VRSGQAGCLGERRAHLTDADERFFPFVETKRARQRFGGLRSFAARGERLAEHLLRVSLEQDEVRRAGDAHRVSCEARRLVQVASAQAHTGERGAPPGLRVEVVLRRDRSRLFHERLRLVEAPAVREHGCELAAEGREDSALAERREHVVAAPQLGLGGLEITEMLVGETDVDRGEAVLEPQVVLLDLCNRQLRCFARVLLVSEERDRNGPDPERVHSGRDVDAPVVEATWAPALVDEVAATGAVDTIDFKGHYGFEVEDPAALGALYDHVLAAFPNAYLEDQHDLPEVARRLGDHLERVSYDAPIRSAEDIGATPLAARVVNVKPSRIGSLRPLFEVYARCAREGRPMYGGGMGELGVGRGQIELLAALFHADAPNDVAPSAYNEDDPHDELPASPLAPRPDATGFRWAA
jgi:hypothetical protein